MIKFKNILSGHSVRYITNPYENLTKKIDFIHLSVLKLIEK